MKETNYYAHFVSISGQRNALFKFWNEKKIGNVSFLEITLRKEFEKNFENFEIFEQR